MIKRIAVLLAIVMIYESVAAPMAQAGMVAQPAMNPAASARIAHTNIGARPSEVAEFIAPFKVPANVGTTVEIHAPTSAGRLVYHLQDVHGVVPAQTNLSEIVSRLESYAADQHKSLVIAVEGGVGVIDTDSLSAFPSSEIKEAVSAALLRDGFLLGEEHAAINHAPGRIKIVGIETPSLYNKNVLAREQSSQARERILLTIREIKNQLNRLKDHNFSELLSTLENNRLAVEDGRMPMSDYLVFLSHTSPQLTKKYTMVSRMLALDAQEKAIDFASVDKEGRLLVEEIINKKSDEEVEKMMKEATALREGRLSPLVYYSGLLEQADKIYPSLEAYVAYLRTSETVNPDALFLEVQDLEVEIAKDLVRHPLAYELYKNIRWIERQERFYSLNMIPQEWALQRNVSINDIFKAHAEIRDFVAEQVGDLGYRFATPPFSMSDLRVATRGAGDFYRAAEARDAEMVNHLQKVLNKFSKDDVIVAVVAGGFHTPGLTRQLREKGLAYQVIRPQLETQVVLNKDITYPAVNAEARLLPEHAQTDFLRGSTKLGLVGQPMTAGNGTAAVLNTMRLPGHPAPRIDRGVRNAFNPNLPLRQRLSGLRRTMLSGRAFTGAEYIALGLFALALAAIVVYLFRDRIFRGANRSADQDEKKAESAPADRKAPKEDPAITAYLTTYIPAPPTGAQPGGSGEVIARLQERNLVNVDKQMNNEMLAAVSGRVLVYVRDPEGHVQPSIDGNRLLVPERFVRSDRSDRLNFDDRNLFTDADRQAVKAIVTDLHDSSASGQSPFDHHRGQMDQAYERRLIEALNDPANRRRFAQTYPAIVAAEHVATPNEPNLVQLATQWYRESNSLRGRNVDNPSDVSNEELDRATRATQNLARLIGLISAVPQNFPQETVPAPAPRTFQQLGAEDGALSPEAIAAGQRQRDLALYYGLLPLRLFAGFGNPLMPIALETGADLAAHEGIAMEEFPNLIRELPLIARPIVDRRVEVEAAAARLGLPVAAGLANQRIEILVNPLGVLKPEHVPPQDRRTTVLDHYIAQSGFFGFPSVTFRFVEVRRVGGGLAFRPDGTLTNQAALYLGSSQDNLGPVQALSYGLAELEVTHNLPNSYYVLDSEGVRHLGGAPLNRVLAANGQILLDHRISSTRAMEPGEFTRPERIQYVLSRLAAGRQDIAVELSDGTGLRRRSRLFSVPDGKLSSAYKARAGVSLDDQRPRSTLLVADNQTQTPENAGRAHLPTLTSHAAAINPAAAERVAFVDQLPLSLIVEPHRVVRDVAGKKVVYEWAAAIFPSADSHSALLNSTVGDVVAADNGFSPRVEEDGEREGARAFLAAAQRQDQNPAFRAAANEALANLQSHLGDRPTQAISVIGAIFGVGIFASLAALLFVVAPFGLDIANSSLGTLSIIFAVAYVFVATVGTITNRLSPSVSPGTTVEALLRAPGFNAGRVLAVLDFAYQAKRSEADQIHLQLKKGILAETEPVSRTLIVGTGLLQDASGLRGVALNILLHIALRQEYVRLSRLQLPATNFVYRRINDLITRVLGVMLAFVPGFLLFNRAPRSDARGPYFNALPLFWGLGRAVRAFSIGLHAILMDRSRTSSDVPNFVAIDVDSLNLGSIDGEQAQGFVDLVAGLDQTVRDQFKPGAQVVFYSASGDAATVTAVQRLVSLSNNRVPGVSYAFRRMSGPVTDVRTVFGPSAQKNLNDRNVIVLGRENTGFTNARFVAIEGIPHLALATFALTHYQDGEKVLEGLVELFEALTPLRRAGSLTNDVMTAVLARLSA